MIFICKICGLEAETSEKDTNGVIKFPKELTTAKLYSNNQFICVCFSCKNKLIDNDFAYCADKSLPEISLKKRFIHPTKAKL